MVKIQIIVGSTRPGRVGKGVADWVYEQAQEREDFEVELVDIADYDLPLLDEPAPAMMGQYTKAHTKKWSAKIGKADGFIFVTPEYNYGIPAALKNAIDFLYAEWNHKALAFVGYGVSGGVRAVEQLRGVAAQMRLADVQQQLMLYLARDFKNYNTFEPTAAHAAQLNKVLDQLVVWTKAMKTVREEADVLHEAAV
ncbi:MAG TPA: NAD(P)H-dependent oxidoreductase [Candidatus Polarisedimenticolaceae bacterium]|nr:NAD(P)H-dependent oxidoreductase [Candidatus Polarisedimenticolaceae bacterium]